MISDADGAEGFGLDSDFGLKILGMLMRLALLPLLRLPLPPPLLPLPPDRIPPFPKVPWVSKSIKISNNITLADFMIVRRTVMK